MKSKIISTIVFFMFAYFLPLAFNLSLLFTVQVALLFSMTVILIGTQPPLSINEINQKYNSDRFSVIGILIACLISQMYSIAEWSYSKVNHRFEFDSLTIIGLILIFMGIILRVYSIRTLGKYFTGTVQTQSDQKIITAGPYRIIRHPSYTGSYLAILGSSVFLHAYTGIIFSAVVIFAAYYYRIKVEEETLVKEFGKEYSAYQLRSKKLIPYIY